MLINLTSKKTKIILYVSINTQHNIKYRDAIKGGMKKKTN